MGVLFDYFAAPDRAAAGAVIESGPDGSFPAVSADGVDPVVLLGTLEELLGGRAYEEQLDDPSAGGLVDQRGEGQLLVLSVSEHTRDLLAGAKDDGFPGVSQAWAEAEEFGGYADPADLEQLLRDLSVLARDAKQEGHQLFCWVSV